MGKKIEGQLRNINFSLVNSFRGEFQIIMV